MVWFSFGFCVGHFLLLLGFDVLWALRKGGDFDLAVNMNRSGATVVVRVLRRPMLLKKQKRDKTGKTKGGKRRHSIQVYFKIDYAYPYE